jgi:hypothetical protein
VDKRDIHDCIGLMAFAVAVKVRGIPVTSKREPLSNGFHAGLFGQVAQRNSL